MSNKTILNLAEAIRARIAPGDGIDLYIPARELELKTTNFDEEELEILEAWEADELKSAGEMSNLLKGEHSGTSAGAAN
jgi:hypothetical protein